MPAVAKNKASVERRNERERKRIRNVNLAFDELREHVPAGSCDKRKISKVDTLQSAIQYIKALESLVKNMNKKNKDKQVTRSMIPQTADDEVICIGESKNATCISSANSSQTSDSFADPSSIFETGSASQSYFGGESSPANRSLSGEYAEYDSGFVEDHQINSEQFPVENFAYPDPSTPCNSGAYGQPHSGFAQNLLSPMSHEDIQCLEGVSVEEVEHILLPNNQSQPSISPQCFNRVPTYQYSPCSSEESIKDSPQGYSTTQPSPIMNICQTPHVPSTNGFILLHNV